MSEDEKGAKCMQQSPPLGLMETSFPLSRWIRRLRRVATTCSLHVWQVSYAESTSKGGLRKMSIDSKVR